jgi:hypothetical protein
MSFLKLNNLYHIYLTDVNGDGGYVEEKIAPKYNGIYEYCGEGLMKSENDSSSYTFYIFCRDFIYLHIMKSIPEEIDGYTYRWCCEFDNDMPVWFNYNYCNGDWFERRRHIDTFALCKIELFINEQIG